ncbi:MAG: protein kinase [Lentisphaeria bacterium]|nr:protein kinase [Lentisphaeria bacterium]
MLSCGEKIYGLTVEEYCGGGAFGEVYFVRDASEKHLALKILSKTKLGADWQRELKGIKNYRKIAEDTPGLLKIYHVGEDDEHFYYTMEPADAVAGEKSYVPDTLAHRLQAGPLPSHELKTVLQNIWTGIVALHTLGFAHRDIKPENVLFVQGHPVLADLGLLTPLTGTLTQLAGTLDFLPPEERLGESKGDSRESRQRNDLYAFGKIIYCCVTGNGANAFPSVSPEMPLTFSNKLFFRLALRMCNRDVVRRLGKLSAVDAEFRRTLRMCEYGETLGDRLRYLCLGLWLWLKFSILRGWRLACRFWPLSVLFSCALADGVYVLGKTLAERQAQQAAMEMAQGLLESEEKIKNGGMSTQPFTFYKGKYTLAIPVEWQVFDHDTLVNTPDLGERWFQDYYGMFLPHPEENGKAATVIAVRIIPETTASLKDASNEKLAEVMKNYLGEDIEAISVRRYMNLRQGQDTIFFAGGCPALRAMTAYAYPQEDHTLLLLVSGLMEKYDDYMPAFLTLHDTIVIRP